MAIENPLLDKLNRSFSLELPEATSIDGYLDKILPDLKPHSEDLREVQFFLKKRWLEVSDKPDFHESVLHIFKEEGEYLLSIDGNIDEGTWETLDGSNTLILDMGDKELYDLAFLNSDFLVLKKHGNQKRLGRNKYRLFGLEKKVKGLVWRDVIEAMYNLHRGNNQYMVMIAFMLVIIALLALFSLS